MDADELTSEEKALIEARIAEHERNPAAAVSLEDIGSRLRAKFDPVMWRVKE